MTYLPSTSANFVSDTTTATKQDVTGVTVPAPANRVIEFEFRGIVTVAATTTGVGFGVTIPSGATLVGQTEIQISTTAGTDNVWTAMLTASDTFSIPTDMAATAGSQFICRGRVVTSTTEGSIQLRIDTDAAAAATVAKGVTRRYVDCCAA